jgi:hypothetical protein
VDYFVSFIISLDYSYHYFSTKERNLYLKEYALADVYYAYLGEVASLINIILSNENNDAEFTSLS